MKGKGGRGGVLGGREVEEGEWRQTRGKGGRGGGMR